MKNLLSTLISCFIFLSILLQSLSFSQLSKLNMEKFAGVSFPSKIITSLIRQKITSPTPIQQLAIPRLVRGESGIIHAATGTGKTMVYLLPILKNIAENSWDLKCDIPKAVIIVPSVELADQVIMY